MIKRSAAAVLVLATVVAFAVRTVRLRGIDASDEWRYYGGNQGANKYSPLDQINRDTIKNLRIVWRQSVTPPDVRRDANAPVPYYYTHTPLMAGGLLYMSTGYGTVAALDPTTGKVVWFDEPAKVRQQSPTVPVSNADRAAPGIAPPRQEVERGTPTRSLAYWTDGTDARVVAITGQSLVALNARTGKRYSDFGDGGEVDLSKGYDRPTSGGYKWRSQPTIVRDVIVVGGLPGDAADIISENQKAHMETPPGDIRGYDVRTGKRLWAFHTVPQPGEVGSETWLKDSWAYSGNAGVWGILSGDDELGYVYLPVESALDYYGGTHPGDNLFSDSIVCLDAKTGKRIWHFQGNHHGIWDYDFTAAPVLGDVTVDGRRVKILAETSKQGFVYVLDRVTGKPVWPIVERPAPKGHVPGEWYSPTQPFPTKPPAFEQQGVSIDDLVDFTPELRRQAIEIVSQYNYGPLYTPFEVPGTPEGKKGTILMPSSIGGNNVNGAGLDPETGILYVPTVRVADIIELVKPVRADSNLPYVRRNAMRVGSWLAGPAGLPTPFKPPYGSLVAIDLNKGELLWRVANGDGPRNLPVLKDLNLPPLGQPGRAAPLVTKALVFLGEGQNEGGTFVPPGGGKMFRAYDKKTGAVVWETELPGGTSAEPMTYLANGKQYLVLAVGWRDMPAELIALAVP
jgi:quinoprotein glucose dehydrogenase